MNTIGFLFDLDGVLIDSEKEYTKIWENIEKKFPTGKKDFALSIKGQTLTKILNENYDNDIREDVTHELHRLEQEMTYSYCRGAEALIDELNRQNGKMAVVTSSDGVKMNHLYGDLPAFRDKFTIIIDAGHITRSKPDPEGYNKAASKLNLDIRRCVVFEDSVQGVMAGKAAGAYVVGITGTKSREELHPFSDMVIDSLEEIDLPSLQKVLKNR